MKRAHVLIAVALVLAGLLVAAVAVATSGESCDEWRTRYRAAVAAHIAPDSDLMSTLDRKLAVYAEKPKGCR